MQDRVALVTGGASGIGAASARRLSREGASVVVVDHDAEGAQRVAAQLPGPALAVTADVSVEADVARATAAALERFGRIDLHHLNAGIVGSFAPFEDLTRADFDQVMDVNVTGVFLGLREAFRQFAAQESGGAIAITASIASLRGASDLVAYHASKHAVLGLMRCAAVHGAQRGVRVNAVAPGIVTTGLFSDSGDTEGGGNDSLRRAMIAPQRRAGTPDEIADVVAFLLGDEAGFLTGEIISVDGGATAMNPVRPSGQRVAEPAAAGGWR
jgi:NAD(P)-dependent dehydrogenase (short-subunit alcohol dehydrogenase family)